MSLWKIAWRSIQQRGLASALTALSMGLGVALVVAVLVAQGVIRDSFTRGASGYHLVVGKKGSQLQLVLNTVYHLQDPIENVPYSFYKEFLNLPGQKGRFADYVKVAIPYCLGDNYEGFRVVGTVPELFEEIEFAPGEHYQFEAGGRNFKHENFFEAVVGAEVARTTGLTVGDEFQPTHGLSDEGDGHKHDAFEVVGVLKPTGTANDRAVFINMEGFYLLDNHAKPLPAGAEAKTAEPAAASKSAEAEKHEHPEGEEAEHPHGDEHPAEAKADAAAPDAAAEGDAHEHPPAGAAADAKHEDHDHGDEKHAHDEPGHEDHAHDDHEHGEHAHDEHDHHDHDHAHEHKPLPEEQREVTSILVLAGNDIYANLLRTAVNEGEVAQAASPVKVIEEFFKKMVNTVSVTLLALTVLIIIIAAVGIMVSIYNSMSERRREIAVMRALGAGRTTVLTVVLLESILLSLGGGVLGFLLGHLLLSAVDPYVVSTTGVSIGYFKFVPYEAYLIPGLVILATFAGYLPALSAYRTDVSKALSANP